MAELSKALRSQLKRNESKNLLHAQVEQLLEIDPTFLAAFVRSFVRAFTERYTDV